MKSGPQKGQCVRKICNELAFKGGWGLRLVVFLSVRFEWMDGWISTKYIRTFDPFRFFPPFDIFSNSLKRGVPFQDKAGMDGGKSNAFGCNGEPRGGVDREETGKDGAGKGVTWVNRTTAEVKWRLGWDSWYVCVLCRNVVLGFCFCILFYVRAKRSKTISCGTEMFA